jgi:hypothetical protein
MSSSSEPAPTSEATATSADEPVSDAVTTAFGHVLEHWDDADAHRRFIALCQTLGALSYAGGQYRHISDLHDAREEMARRQIDAVVASAAAELFSQRQPIPRRAPILLIVSVIVSGGAFLYMLKLAFSLM